MNAVILCWTKSGFNFTESLAPVLSCATETSYVVMFERYSIPVCGLHLSFEALSTRVRATQPQQGEPAPPPPPQQAAQTTQAQTQQQIQNGTPILYF